VLNVSIKNIGGSMAITYNEKPSIPKKHKLNKTSFISFCIRATQITIS
jgi:hypothetical protein